jgi:hypothetical protein
MGFRHYPKSIPYESAWLTDLLSKTNFNVAEQFATFRNDYSRFLVTPSQTSGFHLLMNETCLYGQTCVRDSQKKELVSVLSLSLVVVSLLHLRCTISTKNHKKKAAFPLILSLKL